MTYEDTSIEIYNNENRYLMGTSLLFLIPGVHGVVRKKYLLSSVLFVGPFISYTYWSNPRNNTWRTADMICANLGMGLFIGNSTWNIQSSISRVAIYSCYLFGTSGYIYGSRLHAFRNRHWYLFHMSMHAFMWLGHSLNICVD